MVIGVLAAVLQFQSVVAALVALVFLVGQVVESM
jgi:hypothetical protein